MPLVGQSRLSLDGYWVLGEDGVVRAFGSAVHFGDVAGLSLGARAVGLAAVPAGGGYWVLGEDGVVRAFGSAVHHGDLVAVREGIRATAMVTAPDGNGYLILGPSGITYPFGVVSPYETLHPGPRAPARAIAGSGGRATTGRTLPPLIDHAAGSKWSADWLRMPSSAEPEVTIVIPAHGRSTLTADCLRSIAAHATDDVSFEVLVVDDASRDDTQAMLAAVVGVRVLTMEQNVGFVRAANAGAHAARGRYVVFLNNDTIVRAGWLPALMSTIRSSAGAGIVGPAILQPDGTLQEVGCIVWSDGTASQYGRGKDPGRSEVRFVREVDYCSGCCLLIDRGLFVELGGFDESLGQAYYEDVDLAFRVRERGFRVIVNPRAVVEHDEGSSYGGDDTWRKQHLMRMSRLRFVARWRASLSGHRENDPGNIVAARQRRRHGHVVMVDHEVPTWDQDAGSLRTLRLLEILGDLGFSITFIPDNGLAPPPYAERLEQMGIEVLVGMTEVEMGEHLFGLGDSLRFVLLSRPHPAWRHLAVIRSRHPGVPVLYDTVDLHFLREGRRADLLSDLGMAAYASVIREQELALVRSCDAVLTVTEEEGQLLRALEPGVRSFTVPTIHEPLEAVPGFDDRRGLLFVGGYRHPPNVDCVLWLVDEILPRLRERLPGISLTIVGSNAPSVIEDLAAPDVRIAGWVEDLESVHAAARVFVAPLRYGAGMKGKIGESLANGLPVVTTSVGAEGIGHDESSGLVVADDVDSFVDAVCRVNADRLLWERMSAGGRELVARRFSATAVRGGLSAALGELGLLDAEPS